MAKSLIGQVLLNRYRVERFINSGGMGVVYLVTDLKRNVPLAMKVLHSEFAEDPSILRKFQLEADALKHLAHPHIVPFYGLYRSTDIFFLLQGFIDGLSLKEILTNSAGRNLSITNSLVVLRSICSALGFAHANGIVHCDVKPGNILVDRSGKVFLTDFGIARHADSTTTTLAQSGAPAYMAPEQILGKPVNSTTDIYSLGILMFEMLTGKRPFSGNEPSANQGGESTSERLRYAHLHSNPPDPRLFNAQIPEQLSQVILRALAKEPYKRFQSTNDFLESALSAAGTDESLIPGNISCQDLGIGPSLKGPSSLQKDPLSKGIRNQNPKTPIGFSILAVACVALIFLIFRSKKAEGDFAKSMTTPVMPSRQEIPGQEEAITTLEVIPDVTALPQEKPGLDEELGLLPEGKIVFTCQVDQQVNHDQICLINADGSQRIQLTNDLNNEHYYPSITPDGKSIVFSASINGGFEIFEMSTDGSNLHQLTSGLGECYAPEISPDGKKVVFLRHENGLNHISLIKRDGTFLGDINSDLDCKDPTWEPNGSRILFASSRSGSPQFFVMNSDGSNVQKITNMAGFRGRSDWGIDGRMATYAGETNAHNREIYLFGIDIDPKPITSGGDNLAPSFSPDGKWITFMSYRDNYWDPDGCEIYIMRLEDGLLTRLTDNNYCDWQPRWGP